jgi:hypothetical protein
MKQKNTEYRIRERYSLLFVLFILILVDISISSIAKLQFGITDLSQVHRAGLLNMSYWWIPFGIIFSFVCASVTIEIICWFMQSFLYENYNPEIKLKIKNQVYMVVCVYYIIIIIINFQIIKWITTI